MPLPYTVAFREVIPGVSDSLSVKSVLLSRKKNIYRPLFSFVCSGSCTSMPVPVPCQTSAPPCPAMLFVAALSPAAGPRADGTGVTPRQAQPGQHSDTPACLLITPAPPGLEPACGHGGGEHPRSALRLREGGEANSSRAPPEQGQEKHSSTGRTASPSPAQDTSAGRWAKRAERGGSSWLTLTVALWLTLSTALRGILQPPRLRAGKGDTHPPLLGAGLRGVAA